MLSIPCIIDIGGIVGMIMLATDVCDPVNMYSVPSDCCFLKVYSCAKAKPELFSVAFRQI